MKIAVSVLSSALALAGCVVPADELAQAVVATQRGAAGPVAGAPEPTSPATNAPRTGKAGAVRQIAANIAVDASASDAQIQKITGHLAAARAESGRHLGRSIANPAVTVCVTRACDTAQGFTTRGMSFADRWLHISSRAWDDRATYTHEWVHVETHTPDLLLARAVRRVPIWFDEGLATHISGTVGAGFPPERCTNLRPLELPVPQDSFGAFTKKYGFETGYGAAACRVTDWLATGHRTQDVIGLMQIGALPR